MSRNYLRFSDSLQPSNSRKHASSSFDLQSPRISTAAGSSSRPRVSTYTYDYLRRTLRRGLRWEKVVYLRGIRLIGLGVCRRQFMILEAKPRDLEVLPSRMTPRMSCPPRPISPSHFYNQSRGKRGKNLRLL